MTVIQPLAITLKEFLKQPETKPASEYIDGAIVQKPMPKTRHVRLQGKLIQAINEVTGSQRLDRSVIVFKPQQQPECLHQGDLEILERIVLKLTVEELFSWLQMT